jgi:hypothetical protein
MLFRDYVELLYQAFLQDKGYLTTLRDKIKSDSWTKEQLHDPAFQNWKSINPRDPSTYQQQVKYYPNDIDPEQGVYVYESRALAKRRVNRIRAAREKTRNDNTKESKD